MQNCSYQSSLGTAYFAWFSFSTLLVCVILTALRFHTHIDHCWVVCVHESYRCFAAAQCMAACWLHGDFPHANSGHLLLRGMRPSTSRSVFSHSSTDEEKQTVYVEQLCCVSWKARY